MNKKTVISVIVIILVILGIVIYSNTDKDDQGVIKVGVIIPLSGQYSSFGEGVKNSMEMSLNNLEDKNIELIFEDDEFDSKKGLSAYNKLQSIDDVDVVVALGSPTIEVIKPIMNDTDELMLTVGNETIIENDNVFEIIPWAAKLFTDLGEVISGKYEKVAVVYGSDIELFSINKDLLIEGFDNQDYLEMPVSSSSDFRTDVTKMLDTDIDAYNVFLAVDQAAQFINEVIKQSGDDRPQLICDGNIELTIGDLSSKVIDQSVFEGCLSVMIKDSTDSQYTEEYKQVYNMEPNFLGVYGYDAVQIISNELAGKDKSKWKSILEKKSFSHKGVSGEIIFDETGSRVLESVVHIFKNGEFIELEK